MKRTVALVLLVLMLAVPDDVKLFGTVEEQGSGSECLQYTPTYTPISVTASGVLISGVAGRRRIYCGVWIWPMGTATNVAIVQGTGSTCATGTQALFGGTTAATGGNFGANGGIIVELGGYSIARGTNHGDDTCILLSAGNQVSGHMKTVDIP